MSRSEGDISFVSIPFSLFESTHRRYLYKYVFLYRVSVDRRYIEIENEIEMEVENG